MATAHTAFWQSATVVENTALTSAIRRIVVAPSRPVPADPGSHVDVLVTIGAEAVVRSYSIVDSASDGSSLAISVFASETSRGGATAMHALTAGDRIELTQPLQDFPLRIGAPSYLLLAGGIGITAIAGMARTLAARAVPYRLVYCGRRRDQMAYLDQLTTEHGARLDVHIGDEGTSVDVPELVSTVQPGTELYMCGPIRLMDAVRRAWTERELPASDLRFETFGNSGWHQPEPFRVRIPALGIETSVSASSTLLEALEDVGVDALNDCRRGECGLCEARVLGLHGVIDHRDVFYSERQRDAGSRICVCVSRVRGDGRSIPTITLELS
ncbi:PDR/VanB family oxidoreductase [Agreia bicolorata]|uniref:Flavodoxin n=1 Tax=Agreia bicolorata TaxID=110935 RepID=A0ABR5CG49_9MICO|nr:PDR/VanB family oxidoreductase [Agreia bicolorata]KJC64574.1 flavodoxin [Agreia bicolorata]